MATTQVIIKDSPLTTFLDRVPEMLLQLRQDQKNKDFEAEQRQLDRQYQKEATELNFSREMMGNLYNRNAELDQSMAELGILSMQSQNLGAANQTPGSKDFFEQITSSYGGSKDELTSIIRDLDESAKDKVRRIGSYNMGKGMFSQVDVNDDGTIDDDEKLKMQATYDDLNLDMVDFGAWEQGIYSSELKPADKIALETAQLQKTDLSIRNNYLDASLKQEQQYKNLQIDLLGKDKDLRDANIKKINSEYDKIEQEISMNAISIEQAEQKLADNQYELSQTKITALKTNLEASLINVGKNKKTAALKMINTIGFMDQDKEHFLPFFDVYTSSDYKGDVENLDDPYFFGVAYKDNYSQYEDVFGVQNASISADIQRLFNSLDLGKMGEGDLSTVNVDYFLQGADDIYEEVQNTKAHNSILKGEAGLIQEFHDAGGTWKLNARGVSSFSQFLLNKGYDEAEAIEYFRYRQFKESGFLTDDFLKKASDILDQEIEFNNSYEEVLSQEREGLKK